MHKGQLMTWKDNRGFGFIKPDDGRKEVFLHISALKGAGRRPKVEDTIFYDLVTEADGKVRASKASIHGVAPRPLPTKQKVKKHGLLETVIGIGVIAAIALFTMEFSPKRSPSPITSITKPNCTIKGNISINTGNQIYHLPGMEDYESTVIDLASGEKWFCTESEAIANGWRKAPR
jgi:cold shock CspA family protein